MDTNLEEIRDTTILLFDSVPIKEEKNLPGLKLCVHPFTSDTMKFSPELETMMDLTTTEGYSWYRDIMTKTTSKVLQTLSVYII